LDSFVESPVTAIPLSLMCEAHGEDDSVLVATCGNKDGTQAGERRRNGSKHSHDRIHCQEYFWLRFLSCSAAVSNDSKALPPPNAFVQKTPVFSPMKKIDEVLQGCRPFDDSTTQETWKTVLRGFAVLTAKNWLDLSNATKLKVEAAGLPEAVHQRPQLGRP
jgi:hypothetical protein